MYRYHSLRYSDLRSFTEDLVFWSAFFIRVHLFIEFVNLLLGNIDIISYLPCWDWIFPYLHICSTVVHVIFLAHLVDNVTILTLSCYLKYRCCYFLFSWFIMSFWNSVALYLLFCYGTNMVQIDDKNINPARK